MIAPFGARKTLNRGGTRSTWGLEPMANAAVTGDPLGQEVRMEMYETYTSVLVVLSVALLLITAGVGKKQLEWRRPHRVTVRSRRTRRSRISRD